MAAATSPDLVNVTINGQAIQVPKGELIVEAVKRLGLEIPIFCYHKRMKPVGMCRMCLVEVGFLQQDGSVRMMPKPQAGCTMPMTEGMHVITDSEAIHKDRRGVLEFLLVNHPLDCPICDRGGECPLQNNTIFYGPSTSRFTELKRHAPKAFPLSEHVTLDLERCIQCGRCVRFTEEISGDHQLAFRFRGADMQPSTFKLTDFESKFSGNTIEICPVGALTNSQYRFRARPWDLESKPGICLECSNHCNVWFDYRAGKMVRINGRENESVNEEWTCDKGKFGHEFYNAESRVKSVFVRKGRGFEAVSWEEIQEELIDKFRNGGDQVGFLCGGRASNETLYLAQRFAREVAKTDNIGSHFTKHTAPLSDPVDIASIESKKAILLFGADLADESPIVYLRVRKAATRLGATVFVASDRPSHADSLGKELRFSIGGELQAAKDLLANAEVRGALNSGLVLCTESILNGKDGVEVIAMLQQLAAQSGAEFCCYRTSGNSVGAEKAGCKPSQNGLDAMGILQKCAQYEMKALWLVDCNPFELVADHNLVHDALEGVEYLVVQTSNTHEATGYSSVILPSAAPAEQSGTYTNCEGRVQEFSQVIPTPGVAKAGWRIFAELLMKAQTGTPFYGHEDVRKSMEVAAR